MAIYRKQADTTAHHAKCLSLVVVFMFVCACGPASAQDLLPGSVVTMKNGKSNYHLTQDYNGTRDDKRNVSVWPLPNPPNNGFLWYLEHAGRPHGDVVNGEPDEMQYWHIVNVESSLRLTRDGNDRNVSDWTSDASLHTNQLWKFIPGPGANEFHIVNKLEGHLLDQAYQGNRDDKRNVTVWPIGNVNNFDDQGFSWYLSHQEQNTNLAKLTIKSITCVVPASGSTVETDIAVGTFVAVATAVACPECALLVDITAGGTSAVALAELDGKTSGVDMVYITANHVRVWPEDEYKHKAGNLHEGWAPPYSGHFRPMESKSSSSSRELRVNEEYIFDKDKGLAIGIWEYDYGSGDDRLGSYHCGRADIPGSPECPSSLTDQTLVMFDESEGSVYLLVVSLENI